MKESGSCPINNDVAAPAANDVSLLRSEMMLFAIAHNDATFALHVPQARIISEASSCAKHASFARKDKHRSKNASFVYQKLRFLWCEY